MKNLTRSQTVLKTEAVEALCKRDLVYLSGMPNGRTTVISKIITDLAIDDKGKLVDHIAPRNKGDFEVVILPKTSMTLMLPRLNIIHVQRQILQGCGYDKIKNMSAYEIVTEFNNLMVDMRERKTILCIAIDNAELLSERTFTIIKTLKELVIGGKEVGISAFFAGRYGKIKFPGSYLQHCTEIQVGKITADDEVRELVQTHFPTEANNFTDPALRRLTKQCESTLQLMKSIRLAISERRRLREELIDTETVDTVLSGMRIGLKKAA